jgi:hypothetical protein
MSSSRLFKVSSYSRFEKEAAEIIKDYAEFKVDLENFKRVLQKNPEQGTHLGSGVYKARIEISGKPAGKSYGARVIYAVFTVTEEVLLLKVYDKSNRKDMSKYEVTQIRKLVGILRSQKKK